MNFEETLAQLDKAIDENFKSAEAYYNRAHYVYHYFNENGFTSIVERERLRQDVFEDLNKAIRLNPNYGEAYYLRGIMWERPEDVEQEYYDLNRAIAYDDTLAEAHFRLGGVYFMNHKNYDEALKSYNKAIILDPDMGKAYHLRAQLHGILGNTPEMESDYEKAFELLGDNDDEVHQSRGITLINSKRYDEALVHLDKSIELDPLNIEYYLNKSKLYRILGDEECEHSILIEIFEKEEYRDNHEELSIIYFNRSTVRFKKEDIQGALDDLNKALKINPNMLLALYNRGVIYQNQEEYDKAMQDFMYIKNMMSSEEAILYPQLKPETRKRIKEIQKATGMDTGLWNKIKNIFS